VQADYPGVPISLTGYYNPLPANQTVNKASVCKLMPMLAEALLARTNSKEAVKAIATGQLTSNGVKFEQRLYQTAQTVLSSLNGTLSQEASLFSNVKFVPIDFTGHDFCEDYSGGNGGWVFGPSLHFTFGWTWGLLSGFYERKYSPVDVCSSSLYWCYHRFVYIGSGKKLGFSYSYTFTASANEFPHPTAAGQQGIADLIKTQLGL